MKYFTFIFVIIAGCSNTNIMQENNKMNNLPVIETYDQIKEYDGEMVELIGIYQEFDIRMRKENPKESFKGHAAVYLGEWPVLLYPPDKKDAIRSKKERKTMQGEKVVVVGEINEFLPSEGASLGVPYIRKVESVKIYEPVD